MNDEISAELSDSIKSLNPKPLRQVVVYIQPGMTAVVYASPKRLDLRSDIPVLPLGYIFMDDDGSLWFKPTEGERVKLSG